MSVVEGKNILVDVRIFEILYGSLIGKHIHLPFFFRKVCYNNIPSVILTLQVFMIIFMFEKLSVYAFKYDFISLNFCLSNQTGPKIYFIVSK